jgi:hypothetical protein
VIENRFLTDMVSEEIAREMLIFFRLRSAVALSVLPPGVRPLEVAPGTCLLAIGVQRLSGATFSNITNIGKIYLGIVIHPRLDLGLATPRFAVWSVVMTTDQPAFTAQLAEVDKVPTYASECLNVEFDDRAVRARDAQGEIFSLALTTPTPVFRRFSIWGQVHTRLDGRRFLQANHWSGEAFEHTGTPEVGVVHPHPLFGSLYAPDIGRQAFHQMVMRPGSRATMQLYRPVEMPDG